MGNVQVAILGAPECAGDDPDALCLGRLPGAVQRLSHVFRILFDNVRKIITGQARLREDDHAASLIGSGLDVVQRRLAVTRQRSGPMKLSTRNLKRPGSGHAVIMVLGGTSSTSPAFPGSTILGGTSYASPTFAPCTLLLANGEMWTTPLATHDSPCVRNVHSLPQDSHRSSLRLQRAFLTAGLA